MADIKNYTFNAVGDGEEEVQASIKKDTLKYNCFNCRYLQSDWKCLAYPEGIPMDIITGRTFHNKVLKGQEGEYIYTPKEKAI
jgi:hypothetical protein